MWWYFLKWLPSCIMIFPNCFFKKRTLFSTQDPPNHKCGIFSGTRQNCIFFISSIKSTCVGGTLDPIWKKSLRGKFEPFWAEIGPKKSLLASWLRYLGGTLNFLVPLVVEGIGVHISKKTMTPLIPLSSWLGTPLVLLLWNGSFKKGSLAPRWRDPGTPHHGYLCLGGRPCKWGI